MLKKIVIVNVHMPTFALLTTLPLSVTFSLSLSLPLMNLSLTFILCFHKSLKQTFPLLSGAENNKHQPEEGKKECGRPPKDYSTYWAEFLYLTA